MKFRLHAAHAIKGMPKRFSNFHAEYVAGLYKGLEKERLYA